MGQFSKVSDILNETVLADKNYSASIKKAVAFGFWGNICGSRFSKFSVPYDIKGQTLFVAVKNPQVMQELIFHKEMILKKISDYFLPLNIKVAEIRYDYKNWNKLNTSSVLEGDENLFYYSENEIDSVSLDEGEMRELSNVTNTISNMSFLDENLKDKYMRNVAASIKAKKLRDDKGK